MNERGNQKKCLLFEFKSCSSIQDAGEWPSFLEDCLILHRYTPNLSIRIRLLCKRKDFKDGYKKPTYNLKNHSITVRSEMS
jgi:hypothetical protein